MQQNNSQTLSQLLDDFWVWARTDADMYATASAENLSPFYFPRFNEMRECCRLLINEMLMPQELDNFLTCLALDAEEELILDWCKENGNTNFLIQIVQAGCQHLQPDARWQIAELLRCRNIPHRDKYLDFLVVDTNPYVRKRAQNALLNSK